MSRNCDLTNIGVVSGNRVSHSNIKTKRRFLPNLQHVSLRSDILGININLKLATKTIRTINKYGSLDSFLVNYGYNKLSAEGRKLRRKVIKKLSEKNQISEIKIIKKRNRIEKITKKVKKVA